MKLMGIDQQVDEKKLVVDSRDRVIHKHNRKTVRPT